MNVLVMERADEVAKNQSALVMDAQRARAPPRANITHSTQVAMVMVVVVAVRINMGR